MEVEGSVGLHARYPRPTADGRGSALHTVRLAAPLLLLRCNASAGGEWQHWREVVSARSEPAPAWRMPAGALGHQRAVTAVTSLAVLGGAAAVAWAVLSAQLQR